MISNNQKPTPCSLHHFFYESKNGNGSRVIRVLHTNLEPVERAVNMSVGMLAPMTAWSLLYSGTHRVDTPKDDDSHTLAPPDAPRERRSLPSRQRHSGLDCLLPPAMSSIGSVTRGTHLNITVGKKPKTRDFSLTISATTVTRPHRSMERDPPNDPTPSDTATTKNASPDTEMYTLELGDLGVLAPLNLYAEVRTLLGLPLLVFVMQDFAPHAVRVAISALHSDWSFEVHITHDGATPYLQQNPARQMVLHVFRHYFGRRSSLLTKLTPMPPQKKLLNRQSVDDGRGRFIFSMSLCYSDPPRLELKTMLCGGQEQVLVLEGDPLLVALSNCQVSLRYLEDTSEFVARSLLAALSLDDATGGMMLADQFSPEDSAQ
eukprot:GEMP01052716.1.p1 GENE.GEMP01052716.1~~GEMP01052716.1.p1  ORF type:complete len:375 (+),score=95.39 GEMP01052716.1:364-1488(+)